MHISVIGLWRDSEPYIHRTLSQLGSLKSLNDFKFDFYFYENDSVDSTKDILKNWCDSNSATFGSENLNLPKYGSVTTVNRLILLSLYRNKLKNLAKNSDSDFTLMIDTDIIFSTQNFLQLLNSIKKLNAGMVCANTRQNDIKDCIADLPTSSDSFYDVFALRDIYHNNGIYFSDCPMILESDRQKWFNNEPVQIRSGFSGFALIRTPILQKCYWSTCGHSEHVNFCNDVTQYGNIFIIPECKTYTEIDTSMITPEKYLEVQKMQRQIVLNTNRIYNLSLQTSLYAR